MLKTKSFHKKKKIEKGEGAFSLSLTVEVDRVHSDVDSSASTLFILPDFWNLQTKSFKSSKYRNCQENEVLRSQISLNVCHVAICKNSIVVWLHAFKFLFFFFLTKKNWLIQINSKRAPQLKVHCHLGTFMHSNPNNHMEIKTSLVECLIQCVMPSGECKNPFGSVPSNQNFGFFFFCCRGHQLM